MSPKLVATFLFLLFLGSVGTSELLDNSVEPSHTLMNNSRYVDIMNNWNWSTVLVNSHGVSADDIATDSMGNIYIVGTIEGQPELANSSSFFDSEIKLGQNIFVAKYTELGQLLWLTQAGGNGTDVGRGIIVHETTNQQVRIFVTGHFQVSSIDENQQRTDYDISLGDDVQYVDLIGEKVPFLARLTSSGTWDWAQIASGTGNNGTSNDITIDGSNNLYIAGSFKNQLNFSYIDNFGQEHSQSANRSVVGCNRNNESVAYVASFKQNGKPNFIQTANSCGSYVNTIEARDDSKLFVGGGFWSGAIIGPVTLSIQSGELGAPHGNGYYFVENGVDQNGQVTGSWSPSLEESFVAAINTSIGDWEWIRKITGRNRERVNDIAIDSNGDAIIGGSFLSNISFEDASGELPECCAGTLNSNGDYDIFIAKIDSNGNWKYAESNYDYVPNRPGGSTDFLRSITIDDQDNVYVIGSFVNDIDFGEDTLSSFGNRGELFVSKFDSSDNDHGWVWGCQASKPSGYVGSGISGWNTYRFGGITVDETGIPIVTGYFSTGITFDTEYTSPIYDTSGIVVPGAYVARLSEDCATPNLSDSTTIDPCDELDSNNQTSNATTTFTDYASMLTGETVYVVPFVLGILVGYISKRRRLPEV
jgi:hypothetical protein